MTLKGLPISRLILLYISGATAIVNPVGPTVTSEYSQCLLSLAEDNFRWPGLLVVANTFNASWSSVAGVRSSLLRALHTTARHALQVVSPEQPEREETLEGDTLHDLHFRPVDAFVAMSDADYYVLVVGGFTQFKQIIMKLSTLRTWNPRALFLVMCIRVHRPDDPVSHYPELMLTHLFLLNVFNAVVLLPEARDERRVQVYGWQPFEPPKYCGYKNETASDRLISFNVCNRGIVEHNNYLFKSKIPNRMPGCTLIALAIMRVPFVNPTGDSTLGIEIALMDQIANAMDFKFRYSTVHSQRGERDAEGEWTGALARLKAGEGDLVFGAVFPDNDVHEDYEASISYFSDAYAWVVPRAAPAPPWVALVIIFTQQVWLSALAVYLLCVCAWRLIGQWGGETRYHRTLGHCVLNAWYTTLGGSAYMRPLGHSLRIFFIFFTLYCVLFLTAYQTKLIDVLTNPSFESQLSTPAQLLQSGLRWGGLEELNDLFEDSGDALDGALGAGYVDVADDISALTDVVVHRNFSFLYSRLALLDVSARLEILSDENGMFRFYSFEENVFSIPVEFVSLLGFPFMERMSGLVSAFKQMGVMSLIHARYAAHTARRRARLLATELPAQHEGDAGGRPLSLQHLQGGFLVLATGYVCGALALAVELFVCCDVYLNTRRKFVNSLSKLRYMKKY